MLDEEYIDAIRHLVEKVIGQTSNDPFVYGTFVAAESVDPNLSQVTMADGTLHRGVPRLASATGLVAGDTLLLVSTKTKPLTILNKVVGNIRLYVI